MAVKNIRHFGLVVKDLGKSLNFYKNLLGFKIEKQMNEKGDYADKLLGLENVEVKTVKMSCNDGQMIELLEFNNAGDNHESNEQKASSIQIETRINHPGPTHIAFTIENADLQYKRLKEKGVKFICEPVLSPDGDVKICFCRAPEGTFIELVELINDKK